MAKKHRPPKGPNSSTTLHEKFEGARKSINSVKEINENDNPDTALPIMETAQLATLEKSDSAIQAEAEKILKEISGLSAKILEIHKSIQKRSEDLTRKEEAFARCNDEKNKQREELTKLKAELDQRQTDLDKTGSALTDKERDLELRELDARSGFAAQNDKALRELKNEIAELESKRNEIRRDIHQAEQQAHDDEAKRLAKLMEREAEIAAKERSYQQDQCRLDIEWKELKRRETVIRKEALHEAELELKRHDEARQRTEARLEKAYQDLRDAEEQLEQYRELSESLAGRPAQELLHELAACKQKINQLENQLTNNQDDDLHAKNEELRQICDAQRSKLADIESDLAEAKAELHRLRLGVTDKQNLEKEKQALEKNNRILSSRLDNLGKTVDDLTQSHQAEKPFPQMSWMDSASRNDWSKDRQATELNLSEQDVPNLKQFAIELQHRIAQAEDKTPLYFRLEDIQLLIAGLAMSQLHIFQGISGTGKTSLAKAFAKAVGGQCTDIAVQAGWRDRDDLLGHYNAFEKRFYERDCLQGLYKAGTEFYRDRCNIILLDEMNLSRPEQYFAEFLSALEKNDPRERLISLSERPLPNAPVRLMEGRKICIPENVWFVGTANHDETTNEFADKTYDRAHVMTLPRHETSFEIEEKSRVSYTFKSLMARFDDAITQNEDEVRELLEDLTTGPLTNILRDRFDLGWGNRFEKQALRFIPVFMATGRRKEDALDYLLASRVFRRGKVTGRYDVDIKDLEAIEDVLTNIWKKWSSEPRRSLELLAKDRIRKERNI
ncbi:AAA family ATPase [Candidatus Competibacter denitrificans]|nr:AAA family ATPase [Candidatus Competibacter denitrificans]